MGKPDLHFVFNASRGIWRDIDLNAIRYGTTCNFSAAALKLEGPVMRLARPRFTIRLLMVFARHCGARLALMMTGSRLTRRAERFRQRARLLLAQERTFHDSWTCNFRPLNRTNQSEICTLMLCTRSMDQDHGEVPQYDRTIAQIQQEAQFSRSL